MLSVNGSGYPTRAGSYEITYQTKDNDEITGKTKLKIIVEEAPEPIYIEPVEGGE